MKTFTIYYADDPFWRNWLMSIGLMLSDLADSLFVDSDEITALDYIRWWIDDISLKLYTWGWEGSNDSLCDALNDEIPWQYLDDRQKAHYIAIRGIPQHLDEFGFADDEPQLLLEWRQP